MSRSRIKGRSPRKIEEKRLQVEENDLPVAFSFAHLASADEYDKCTRDEKKQIADAMIKRRSFSLTQLESKPAHALGTEKIAAGAIKRAIPADLRDRKYFLSMRFCGKAPLVGYGNKGVFYIVWIDRSFDVYDHE